MSIPKKIQYCWFGGNKPERLLKRCMASWQKFCPDYEFICWNEENAPLDSNAYVKQAYKAGKWAFVSDYVRIWALYRQGGVYLDTDVELLAPLDVFLGNRAFMGFESADKAATCVLGCEPGHAFFRALLAQYEDKMFIRPDGSLDETTNVELVTKLLDAAGLQRNNQEQTVAGVRIYPMEYFSPKDLRTGRLRRTARTVAVHHFCASWMSRKQRFHTKAAQLLGPRLTALLKRGSGQ